MQRARSFGTQAAAYARARPSYPPAAARFVLPRVPCRVADVGAGTGKLTGVLLGLGCEVVAVEPDDGMRALIEGAEAVAGEAEALPLPTASVDAVTAGQAFHWFDPPRFVDEAARVLRPGGAVGLLWNEADDRVPWVAELVEIAGFGAVLSRVELTLPFADDRFEPGELGDFPYVQRLDADGLVALVSSQSHTIMLPPAERAAQLAEVERFARSRFGDGGFELPYLTRAWRLRLRGSG